MKSLEPNERTARKIGYFFLSLILVVVCFVGYKSCSAFISCFTPREATPDEVAALASYKSAASSLYNAKIEQKGRFTLIYYVPKQADNYDLLASQMLDEARHEGCTQITRVEIHDPVTDEMTGHAVFTGRY